MRTTLTLLPLFALFSTAQAQITIGQNEMPTAGDQLTITRATNNPFLDYATTGPASVWDFANLTAGAQETTPYFNVASTNFVYAIAYADVFFNPNRANVARDGVAIAFNELLDIQDPYTFNYRSASTYRTIGFGAGVAGIPLPIIFTQADEIYALPLEFGDNSVSNSAWNIRIPSLAYYGYEQQRTNEVDGWGSITTPAGSFDALRVKTTLVGNDTINVDTLGIGFAIDRPIVREYKWLAQDLRVPVLQISTAELFGIQVITDILFYDVPRSLTVDAPLSTSQCPGSTFQLDYTANGAFNAGGFLSQPNVFRAQLSDANGSFATPVNLGAVTAMNSGSISVTIPANTPLGTGYRIRVVASNPALTGPDNGVDIEIGGPPVAAFTALGDTEFCEGGSVELQATIGQGGDLQWQLDDADIPGATDPSFEANTTGIYTLVVSNACGVTTAAPIPVTVNATPVVTIDQDAVALCAGTSTSLTSSIIAGSDLAYQWNLNDSPIPGATESALEVSEAGMYTLSAIGIDGQCASTTDALTVVVDEVEAPELSAAGATNFCSGESVILSATGAEGTYQWFLDGNSIDGATDLDLEVSEAGTYTATLTNANACASGPSVGMEVTVATTPADPEITFDGPTTICEGETLVLNTTDDPELSYAWTLDGDVITDATTSTLMAIAAGSYSVTIGSEGCTATATESVVVIVNEAPETPVISLNGLVLSTTGNGSFQWSFNGLPVAGATDPELAPFEVGTYTVTVTDDNGCSSTSEPYLFLMTSIASNVRTTLGIQPNPSNGQFRVAVSDDLIGGVWTMSDITGRIIAEGSVNNTNSHFDLQGHSTGVHFIRIQNGAISAVSRVILQ